jgi:osmotically-inducible protein OsmY
MTPPRDEPKHYVIARAREALAGDGRTSALDLEVAVAGGKVFVTGEVQTEERSRAVTEILRECLPGWTVSNEVKVVTITDTEEVETLS